MMESGLASSSASSLIPHPSSSIPQIKHGLTHKKILQASEDNQKSPSVCQVSTNLQRCLRHGGFPQLLQTPPERNGSKSAGGCLRGKRKITSDVVYRRGTGISQPAISLWQHQPSLSLILPGGEPG